MASLKRTNAAAPKKSRTRGIQAPDHRTTKSAISAAEIEQTIRSRAYELFEKRNREHGRDLDDWLLAEAEVRGQSAL